MSKVVVEPPKSELLGDGSRLAGWWHEAEDGRLVCDLCPRECHLKEGDRGFCFVREHRDGEMVLSTYGKSTGFCIDPIEKKPLNHFLPGTAVLSFGTAGCNLGCKFCQNWDISKSREVERLSQNASPETIANAALKTGCRSVAYTYNDPIVWAEYAMDTAVACRERGIKNVAVTAGYISPEAREPFFRDVDAANVDLKSFSEEFYWSITYSHLQPVLDTLIWLKNETDIWFEITNLIIPQANDSDDELKRFCEWIVEQLGVEVPVHFTAFHPDFRMTDRERTPHQTLLRARQLGLEHGLKFVYVGNVNDWEHQSTYCPNCKETLIERNWYELGAYTLNGNRCQACDEQIAGVFEQHPGDWGRKRLPLQIQNYAIQPQPRQLVTLEADQDKQEVNQGKQKTMSNSNSLQTPPVLSSEQESLILHAAAQVMHDAVTQTVTAWPDATLAGAADRQVMGIFVTAKRNGRLRGCCGSLGVPMRIGDALRQSATRTAIDDPRFPPMSVGELPYQHLDVTLLANFERIDGSADEKLTAVEIGKHGLQIRLGQNSGLLLPSVATDNNWDARQFLDQVCRKANLPVTAWQDSNAELQRFEGHVIEGGFPDSFKVGQSNPFPFDLNAVKQLANAAGQNIIALLQGATPSYYLPNCPDGSVHGIVLSLHDGSGNHFTHFSQQSTRPPLPLQSTLFKLCENAAATLKRQNYNKQLGVDISIMMSPVIHGWLSDPDLRGFEPAQSIMQVSEQRRYAWLYDPQKSGEEIIKQIEADAKIQSPQSAVVHSLSILSTAQRVHVIHMPRGVPGAEIRPPAVAGSFYPRNADDLKKEVERLLGDRGDTRDCRAIMVPHAGWRFSGQLAADVIKGVKIPDTVIVIGPKHTRNGVDLAVAPNRVWTFPSGQLESDVDLAQKLAQNIPGLQLDAAAHAQEHGIEVELPFLAACAPATKVVGITVGGGDFTMCQNFAKGLADVLSDLPEQPLLVISSDMNHYASDSDTRRLDELALQSLETLRPSEVYDTVVGNGISMCGVLPAVIVMETLKILDQLNSCERVGYATSADVSGDKSRVVGYAGMLFE